jgi:signal transduction histidine kinase
VLLEISDVGKPGGGSLPGQALTEPVGRENGLRFSLARALVLLHGGEIKVVEDAEGGSRTVVTLPDA